MGESVIKIRLDTSYSREYAAGIRILKEVENSWINLFENIIIVILICAISGESRTFRHNTS